MFELRSTADGLRDTWASPHLRKNCSANHYSECSLMQFTAFPCTEFASKQHIYQDLRRCGRMDQRTTLPRIMRPNFCRPKGIELHVIATSSAP